MSIKEIVIDGVVYDITPKHTTDKYNREKYICTLDGIEYYLGPGADLEMSWKDAQKWCKGVGGVLPSRVVTLIMFEKDVGVHSDKRYWTSTEYSTPLAWSQSFRNGYQGAYDKFSTVYVRAVFTKEVG